MLKNYNNNNDNNNRKNCIIRLIKIFINWNNFAYLSDGVFIINLFLILFRQVLILLMCIFINKLFIRKRITVRWSVIASTFYLPLIWNACLNLRHVTPDSFHLLIEESEFGFEKYVILFQTQFSEYCSVWIKSTTKVFPNRETEIKFSKAFRKLLKNPTPLPPFTTVRQCKKRHLVQREIFLKMASPILIHSQLSSSNGINLSPFTTKLGRKFREEITSLDLVLRCCVEASEIKW